MGYALVTGSSKGIGRAIALNLAGRGYDLLLVARSEDVLAELALEITNTKKVQAHYLALDLSAKNAENQILSWVESKGYEVSVLVNNAGYGLWGNFSDLTLEEQNNMMQLNMNFLVNLTYKLIPYLKKQPKSYILNVGSTAAYQAVPTLSLYAATKSFVVLFTRGLRHELARTPISVSCLSPGGTKTGFIERSRMHHLQKTSDKLSMEPEEVAEIGVKGMLKGKMEIIPGFLNWFSVGLIRMLPKVLVEKAAGNLYKQK